MYGLSVLFFSYRVVSKRSIRSYSSDSTKKLLEFLAAMPKATSTRIAEAQRQRQQITKKSEKYAPSTVYLQVLGSGARGAPNTLYLFTDQKRYLFNCGECTQRLAHEHKVKLSRLDHIFITSKTWRNIGGLPGLSLTLQDVGVPNITLHGPEGLDELYAATKRFVIMKDMQVTMAKCTPSEDFDDNVMSVKYVLLGPHDNILTGKDKSGARKTRLDTQLEKEYEEFSHDETDYYKPEQRNIDVAPVGKVKNGKEVPNREKAKPKPFVGENPMKKKTEKVLHELQKKTNCSVAFICTLKKRLGTLDLAKCVAKGVKPGPQLGQLKSGLDVLLPDGTLVLSKDVKTPDDPGPVFIVLDVPELSYLKESEFSVHFDNGTNPPENIPSIIVHFTPPDVFHHPTYRAFLSLFGPLPRHLVLNSQNSCLGSEAVHRTQHKLHLLDPDIFPLLRDVSVPAVWSAQGVPKTNSPVRLKGLEELKNKIALAQFQNIINLEGSAKGDGHAPEMDQCDSVTKLELLAGRTLTMYHLRPKKQLDRSAEPKLHIQDYIQETMDVDGFVGSLEQFRRLVDSMRYARCESKEFPKVVFLGTGSCIPSKTRNTSAIVLQIDENHSILMDCGEGTFGQLVRFYGPKKVNAFLRTLNAIYISHLHADHHIGLIGVIQARRQAMKEIAPGSGPALPLYLLAPGQIVTWLTLYHAQFERLRNDYTLIPNQNLLHNHPQHSDVTSAVLAAIGVQAMTTCLVSHCPNAFGVSIEVDNRYKLTYSGDTLPCEELVTIGQNSTLLIHEATMEDELADEARTKMHSTTTQAIDIGRQMNARYTVLTHFSQRYARLPRLNSHILHDNNSVGIAFDNMQIAMSDLELLPHMYAPLQLMFAEHCVEMELKAAQRQRIRERRASTPSITPVPPLRRVTACRGAGAGSNAATPPPPKRPRYTESNASRLRQEIRGMTITGTVRNPRSISSRSNSASESGSPGSRKTTPRNATPRNTTPRNISRQPSKERCKDRSRNRHTEHPMKGKQEAASEKDKPMEICAAIPRSASEISTFARTPNSCPSGLVCVDTRSKTVNSVCPGRPPTAEEVMDLLNDTRPREKGRSGASKSADCKGYGKPLVTSLNKRLTIRREQPWPHDSCKGAEKVAPTNGSDSRSPNKKYFKAENRESPSRNASHQRPKLISTKIPTKVNVSGNKLRESNTNPNVFPDTKIPILRANLGGKSLRPSASSLHGRRSNSRSPLRPKSTEKSRDSLSIPTYKLKLDHHDPPEIKHWTADRTRTPSRSPNRGKSPMQNRFAAAEAKRKSLSPTKDERLVREKSKQSANKELSPNPPLTRPSHKNAYRLSSIVNQFNEERRRHMLIKCKKKFQSSTFFEDSKFEKIEGLNWITWK